MLLGYPGYSIRSLPRLGQSERTGEAINRHDRSEPILGIYIDDIKQYPRFANQSKALIVRTSHLNYRVEGQFCGYKII